MCTRGKAQSMRVPREEVPLTPLRGPTGVADPTVRLLRWALASVASDGRREASQAPGSRVTNVLHSEADGCPCLWHRGSSRKH